MQTFRKARPSRLHFDHVVNRHGRCINCGATRKAAGAGPCEFAPEDTLAIEDGLPVVDYALTGIGRDRVEKEWPTARNVALMFARRNAVDPDDAVSAATLVLVDLAARFNHSGRATFHTYVCTFFYQRMKSWLYLSKKHWIFPIGVARQSATEEVVVRNDLVRENQLSDELIALGGEKYGPFLRKSFIEGLSGRQIAREFGISEANARQRVTRGLKYVRSRAQERGICYP